MRERPATLALLRSADRVGPAKPELAADSAAVLGAMPVAVLVLDSANRFLFANQAAEQFLGLSLSQLRQIGLADIVPADNPLFPMLAQVRAAGITIAEHDLVLESPRLHRSFVTAQAAPLLDDAGTVVVNLLDFSAARALNRQLGFRSAARSVSGMAAVLAHEIKNPLSGIRGAAQLLEASIGEADRDLAVLIRDEADRITALVERMEVFGEAPVPHRALNIHRVLEHVRKLARSGFAASLRIHEQYDPSLPSVWGDRDQLVQVLLNLVKNAAESIIQGQHGGDITLCTAYEHGLRVAVPGGERRHLPLLVVVRDTGPGISEDIRPHLFEPFVTSKPSGSGLGLPLVAKIVGDHGGLIEVESRPGRTEFRIHLPVYPEEPAPARLPVQDEVER